MAGVKIICYWTTLFTLAREKARAEASKDPERIATATERHASYEALCLRADEVR